jgi:hypothetical protein
MKYEKAGENCILKTFIMCISRQILLELSKQEDEMGRACSKHKREQKCIQSFGRKTIRKESLRIPRYR